MLKTKQLSDLEGAAEDLKNKAMILQTGIDLQALLRLLVDKGIISREEIREYRNEVSGSPKWGAAVSFIEQTKAEIEHYEANPRELLAEDYPPVILTQCDPKGHLHLKLVINFVPIHLHHLQTFSLELLNPFADIIPYYPCFSQCFQCFRDFLRRSVSTT